MIITCKVLLYWSISILRFTNIEYILFSSAQKWKIFCDASERCTAFHQNNIKAIKAQKKVKSRTTTHREFIYINCKIWWVDNFFIVMFDSFRNLKFHSQREHCQKDTSPSKEENIIKKIQCVTMFFLRPGFNYFLLQ